MVCRKLTAGLDSIQWMLFLGSARTSRTGSVNQLTLVRTYSSGACSKLWGFKFLVEFGGPVKFPVLLTQI